MTFADTLRFASRAATDNICSNEDAPIEITVTTPTDAGHEKVTAT